MNSTCQRAVRTNVYCVRCLLRSGEPGRFNEAGKSMTNTVGNSGVDFTSIAPR
jgi:hypothetical protein